MRFTTRKFDIPTAVLFLLVMTAATAVFAVAYPVHLCWVTWNNVKDCFRHRPAEHFTLRLLPEEDP